MAAGTSSRFAPLSYERNKALIEVRGEILIERQIRQLKSAGIDRVFVITGYKAEQFDYLVDKFGVELIHNPYYLTRNNNSSIFAAKDYIRNSYICSADNYFVNNPFENEVEDSFYSAVYVEGKTDEWCINSTGEIIDKVTVGGKDSWIMLGHVFWSKEFSKKFVAILEKEYRKEETAGKLWEKIYCEHMDELKMKIRKYPPGCIFEFDTLDELRVFDPSYQNDTRSLILNGIATELHVSEAEIHEISAIMNNDNAAIGFSFITDKQYKYLYETRRCEIVL